MKKLIINKTILISSIAATVFFAMSLGAVLFLINVVLLALSFGQIDLISICLHLLLYSTPAFFILSLVYFQIENWYEYTSSIVKKIGLWESHYIRATAMEESGIDVVLVILDIVVVIMPTIIWGMFFGFNKK